MAIGRQMLLGASPALESTLANRAITILMTCLIAALITGCARSPERAGKRASEVDSVPVTLNANPSETAITWLKYEGVGDPESAEFMVNRRVVGTGKAGFREVIGIIEKLPRQSTVLIYPYYQPGYVVHVMSDGSTSLESEGGSGPIRWFPFEEYEPEYDKFRQAISERKLSVSIALNAQGLNMKPLPLGRGVRLFAWPGAGESNPASSESDS